MLLNKYVSRIVSRTGSLRVMVHLRLVPRRVLFFLRWVLISDFTAPAGEAAANTRRADAGVGARVASLDLLAVAGLCHERTLEVTQLKQPALMAEHKLTQ